jgi:hypothetical protein
MSAHHVDLPEQVVTPGEELWVKIIDLDLNAAGSAFDKQAAGGVVAAEYQEHFGEHAYDEEGNYIGPTTDGEPEQAWPMPRGHRTGRPGRPWRGRSPLPMRLLWLMLPVRQKRQ